MMADEYCRYLPKQLLIEYNRAAKREKRKYIDEHFLDSLPDINYRIQFLMYHSTNEIRTGVILDAKGNFTLLDMSIERFELIPKALKTANGETTVKSEKEIRKTMPYNGIEWVESKTKKPYRGKQSSFRHIVLNAYGNTCAVCECKQRSSLRAAHIKDKASGGSDEINNGICLCANHEIAFDRGVLKIRPDGTVYSLGDDKTITVKSIKLPKDKSNYPSKELLQWKYDNT